MKNSSISKSYDRNKLDLPPPRWSVGGSKECNDYKFIMYYLLGKKILMLENSPTLAVRGVDTAENSTCPILFFPFPGSFSRAGGTPIPSVFEDSSDSTPLHTPRTSLPTFH